MPDRVFWTEPFQKVEEEKINVWLILLGFLIAAALSGYTGVLPFID